VLVGQYRKRAKRDQKNPKRITMSRPMSEREIAKALGISRARVRYHLNRAIKKISNSAALRNAIEDAHDSEHRKSVQENCARMVDGTRK
jgi:predicted transcriptional regulator